MDVQFVDIKSRFVTALACLVGLCVIHLCYQKMTLQSIGQVTLMPKYTRGNMTDHGSFKGVEYHPKHADWAIVPERWKDEMETRRNQLERACAASKDPFIHVNQTITRNMTLRNIFVDDRHRLLLCAIPKVGCINFYRLLSALTANLDADKYATIDGQIVYLGYRPRLRSLDTFSDFGIKFRLKYYLKFVPVRHPLERLVSAYRDRIEGGNKYYTRVLAREISRYEKNVTNEVRRTGNWSFAAFVKYLANFRHEPHHQIDIHFKAFHEICFPCSVRYDVIARHETVGRDVSMVLKMIRAKSGLQYPTNDRKPTHSENVWLDYFRLISKADVAKLWYNYYGADGRLFNYNLTDDIGHDNEE